MAERPMLDTIIANQQLCVKTIIFVSTRSETHNHGSRFPASASTSPTDAEVIERRLGASRTQQNSRRTSSGGVGFNPPFLSSCFIVLGTGINYLVGGTLL